MSYVKTKSVTDEWTSKHKHGRTHKAIPTAEQLHQNITVSSLSIWPLLFKISTFNRLPLELHSSNCCQLTILKLSHDATDANYPGEILLAYLLPQCWQMRWDLQTHIHCGYRNHEEKYGILLSVRCLLFALCSRWKLHVHFTDFIVYTSFAMISYFKWQTTLWYDTSHQITVKHLQFYMFRSIMSSIRLGWHLPWHFSMPRMDKTWLATEAAIC